MRDSANRVKNYTGTVHYATNGRPDCGPVPTHGDYLRPTVEDVTCGRCIARFGADEATGLRDPKPYTDEHVARRSEERRLRQEARRLACTVDESAGLRELHEADQTELLA